MPYKDREKQRKAVREAVRRHAPSRRVEWKVKNVFLKQPSIQWEYLKFVGSPKTRKLFQGSKGSDKFFERVQKNMAKQLEFLEKTRKREARR